MISIPKTVIEKTKKEHVNCVSDVLLQKIATLNLCLEYLDFSSKSKNDDFDEKLRLISGSDSIKVISINWFLKRNSGRKTRRVQRKIASVTKTQNFFKHEFHVFSNKPIIINSLKSVLSYLNRANIERILEGEPTDLLSAHNDFEKALPALIPVAAKKQILRLISFLFDYDIFSKKESIYTSTCAWGGYEFTKSLEAKTCLYCNRNSILTVSPDDRKIIRPELDHFFAKSKYPILAISFHNLIPSCHICNSNLKGSTQFSLANHLHPYISDFDKENVKFTYRPTNPLAFFSSDGSIEVKLDLTNIRGYKNQIQGNILQFKLNDIYSYHLDIVDGLMELHRKTNKNKIKDTFENILVDNSGNKYSYSEEEIYAIAIRSHYNPQDFHKKPMSKFEKDIAMEIGLIDKK